MSEQPVVKGDDTSYDKTPEVLEALAYEREGYVAAGDTDRVAQVDAEIKRLGGKPPAKA